METKNFKEENYFNNQKNIIDNIPINPILPENFWVTAHEDREQIELDEWWERPFITTEDYEEESYHEYYSRMKAFNAEEIETEEEYNSRILTDKKNWYNTWSSGIRYDVYILDGGAWDRPTVKAKVGSLEEAIKIAKNL